MFLNPSTSLATDLTIRTNPSHFITDGALYCPPTAPIPGFMPGFVPGSITNMQTSSYTASWKPQTEKPYTCSKCGKGLSYVFTLNRHCKTTCNKERNTNGEWKCENCPRSYQSKGNLVRHTNTCGKPRQFHCIFCLRAYTQNCSLKRHLKSKHKLSNDKKELDKNSGTCSSTESLPSSN